MSSVVKLQFYFRIVTTNLDEIVKQAKIDGATVGFIGLTVKRQSLTIKSHTF